MDIFSVLMLVGGLAFFLYGMNVLSESLEKMAGGKLQGILEKMTSNRFKSLMLGALITAAIQSSSAVTVMLVGLVNSGIMQLGQTIGVLMGSNIGTTATAWILSLGGIDSDNMWVKLIKPENFTLVFAMVGILLLMTAKNQKKKDIGNILVGFAILIYGMKMMGDAVNPLSESEKFQQVLLAFENPFFGVLMGTVVTAIIQSSSASVGILQTLTDTGVIRYSVALPIIMGQNIGTCITAVISSIGVNKNAKRVAVVHMAFNLIGTAVCLVLYCIFDYVLTLPLLDAFIDRPGVAICHTLFNVFTTILLFPFIKQLEKLAKFVVKDTEEKERYAFIDERLLNTPSVAIYECNVITQEMAGMAKETIERAIALVDVYSEEEAERVKKMENKLDYYEDELGTFLVKLSAKELSEADSRQISKLLHTIGDLERISDHAVSIVLAAKEMQDKAAKFSEHAMQEIDTLKSAILEILEITMKSYKDNDTELARKVEPLEQVIDRLIEKIRHRHIARLKDGRCTIEHGIILSDLLSDLSRVSDHCSNIAVATIEVDRNQFETHQYLKKVKYIGDEEFNNSFVEYGLKYELK
ncbi:MAG: Na/Pi cotransporter family protein [Lachnospiraceae bacterium]|nr:Na/Pi cotransporter family protein [Lachnospiraceae bacterium]